MSSKGRDKVEKRKRREKKLRRERNLRRNRPRTPAGEGDEADEFDVERALEELPIELQFERVMRRVARATGKREFADGAAVLAAVEELEQPGQEERLAELQREDRLDFAQDFAFMALDRANFGFARDLAGAALELDPQCVDALALAAILNGATAEERLAGLERAVATGEHALGGPAFLAENRGRFWNDVLTRPYMRARRMLADARRVSGDLGAAAAHFEALLELDPEDQIDVRDGLLGIMLERRDLVRARALLERSEENRSPIAPWARVLEQWLSGDRSRAARELHAARETNGLAEVALIDPTDLVERERELELEQGDADEFDSDLAREAALVAVRLGRAWAAHPEALAWLANGGPASTEEEQRAAIASFSFPVSQLFELGEIEHGAEWREYAEAFRLTSEDVPELIRMATHSALHELDTEPEAWSVAHAWRALGELQAESAVVPLLELTRTQRDDDGLLSDLARVLARIGPASLPRVIAWMKADAGDVFRVCVGCEALPVIAGSDAWLRARAIEHLGGELDLSAERDEQLNGWLIAAAIELHAVELAPRIRRAFEEGHVDPTIAGDWDDVREALGVDAGD